MAMSSVQRKAYRYVQHRQAGGLINWRTGELSWPPIE
jgi:hypothetical protein